MTDYTDLISELRSGEIGYELAAANAITDLEAELHVSLYMNDRLYDRIAELEAEIKHLEQNFTEWLKEYRKQGDRIAELEAALSKSTEPPCSGD